MSAREEILGRLRRAAVPTLPLPDLAERTAPAAFLQGDALHRAVPVFSSNLRAAHAELIDASAGDWAARVQEFCKTRSIRRCLLPNAPLAIESLGTNGVLERFDQPIELCKDALFNDFDAGLTVADCAIADTGMLLLRSTPAQPRTLSLVPPIHICLLNVNRLYASLDAAVSGENWAAGMPSNLIFISGPSKTADIQQTLAYGAHGPKELIVVLVKEDVLS